MKSVVALLLAMVALGIFGCGGDGGGELSKSEFLAQGNHACRLGQRARVKAMRAKVEDFNVKPGELATPAQQEKIILAAVPGYEEATEKLRELAPSDEAEKIDPIIEAREETAEHVRSNPGTATHSGIQFEEAKKLAKEYGLIYC